MSDKVTTRFDTLASAPAPTGPKEARYFVVGQTQKGPKDAPRIVTSLAGYVSLYGARTGGADMYDSVALALRSGASEVVVQRAVGPVPVAATVSLDSGKIVVSALDVGAFANGWTAAWDASETLLTISDATSSFTETYTGATAAALTLAASYSGRIAVTSSGTLPTADVAAAALATGTDNFTSVDWEDELAKIGPDLGAGAIAVPGVAYSVVGELLLAHARANVRHALLTAASGATPATIASASGTADGYDGAEFGSLLGPWVKVPDGAGSTRTVDPTGYAAGLRAAALRNGPGESAADAAYAVGLVDVVPEYELAPAGVALLAAANVSTIRTIGGRTRLYDYRCLAAPGGNPNIQGGVYRDLLNTIAFQITGILDQHVNKMGTDTQRAIIEGQINGYLAGLSGTYLAPRKAADGTLVDSGFRVEISTGSAPADNRWVANVAVRLTESIDAWDFVLAVGDATATL